MTAKMNLFKRIVKAGVLSVSLFFVMFCAGGISQVQASGQKDPAAGKIKGATYVGTDTCLTCHEQQGKEYALSFHGKLAVKGVDNDANGCETCHGPGSLHVDAGGGKGVSIINPKKDPSPCFTCHMEKKMEFRLPNHHPVLEGKMSCTDCHELHSPDVMPNAVSMESQNELCFKCHKDQQGPFVYDHAAMREGCTSCHKVHGSINEKMLKARDANLCMHCHTDTLYPSKIGVGGNHNSSSGRLRAGTCWSAGCHVAPHGSNFSSILSY